ncbi:hypothetical protein [Rubinisphaera sp.]|uniref:hypothetical protein n=1 Tax=Rubinisphaera sp. TaxID=2024857 RepID=UPI000C109E35|nr:hypothetical protein [Rubinisphaera sp.]MBV09303.1 hypothetical protein [Rubinisphaera sp.]HCS54499.1 hypothetical protein [Planctomycetaceae bacterium]|tara:strand:+ start:300 stop:632 length:333 start_codon:yes stop_codon:yes gene_type:complete
MPTVEQIDPGFSTADASHPSINYDSGNLYLKFIDWRERTVLVTFHDTCRFEWVDEPDDSIYGEPYDGSCVIRESNWIPDKGGSNCQHYRLNFNACGGRLDVAFVDMKVET